MEQFLHDQLEAAIHTLLTREHDPPTIVRVDLGHCRGVLEGRQISQS
jgi:hypothetical protein